jgi:RHH-type proline utilization regulon transcriptional repressor/proline dehydrogenase/delta 1-pyrroline-5-carboxylate dehydrogenase
MAHDAAADWAAVPVAQRAAILRQAADAMEAAMEDLLGLMMREAGKTAANAIAEVREAVDFLRYYADEAERGLAGFGVAPLGTIGCISPWNFPLSIFTGQVAAALAAGNAVVAKPAEETPLIAGRAIKILHDAGVPEAVLQLLIGAGEMGAALVADKRICGIMFTGSTEVARLIARQLAERTLDDGRSVPLIAETGGQNAMIVDSSALTEQVVGDVLASAFDSAGQRCSALRVLCVQEDVADKTIRMIKGAMANLRVGNPDRLATDVGPVITAEAQASIARHIETMRGKGHTVTEAPMPPEVERGTFIAPTLIEISDVTELKREVFGPVLHVVRYRREKLGQLVDAINGLGYGLTFGLHTRIDTVINEVLGRIGAGNIYVNRNQIGAVVGVQPFGGHGLSGTGPKAGGPLYLRRLVRAGDLPPAMVGARGNAAARGLIDWLTREGDSEIAKLAAFTLERGLGGVDIELMGPVGERNRYQTRPRGTVLAIAESEAGLWLQVAAALGGGNRVAVEGPAAFHIDRLPGDLKKAILAEGEPIAAVLVEGDGEAAIAVGKRVAGWQGPIVPVQAVAGEDLRAGRSRYQPELLVDEVSVSINTAAAGGNASLMSL